MESAMKKEFTIRKANRNDLSRIAEIQVFNYRLYFYPIFKSDEYYFDELSVPSLMQKYESELDSLYVYDDGVVKGMIRLDQDEVVKLYVEPQFQGEKIGTKLLNFATTDKGAKWLWVLEQNERGIRFYKRNGFDFNGETMLEDDWVPLKKMTL
jgi:putative acetyltransferase